MALFHQIKRADPVKDIQEAQEKAFRQMSKSDDGTGLQKLASRAGRKADPNAKQLLTLRLDPDVIAYFRSTGEGWQTRMNEALRKAAGL